MFLHYSLLRQHYRQIEKTAKPFVKWAGGKRQLVPAIEPYFPQKFGGYFEPFLGGGAILFHILSQNPNQKCTISDLNSDLVLAYVTVRDRVEDLIDALKGHSKKYLADKSSYYYRVRGKEPTGQISKCSRLIFLNHTCFNGLYRVNSKGKFNVPLGRYSNPNIVNEDNLRSVSKILQSKNIDIRCSDFSAITDGAKKGDFAYFDPPYQPTSPTAAFTSYTSRDFGMDDLDRLAGVCRDLDSRGCKVVLSHSKTKEASGMFGRPWKILEIRANRAINSNSKKRTGHTELLIRNF